MAIFDCFQYFNEDHIVDLRLNILNENIDYFVISESTRTHQGKKKKLKFTTDRPPHIKNQKKSLTTNVLVLVSLKKIALHTTKHLGLGFLCQFILSCF